MLQLDDIECEIVESKSDHVTSHKITNQSIITLHFSSVKSRTSKEIVLD